MNSTVVSIADLSGQEVKWTFEYFDPVLSGYLGRLANPTPLGDLIKEIRYGASLSPDYSEMGILFIRAQNIRDGGVDLTDVRYIPEEGLDVERFRLKAGDLLITRSGINVGDAAVVPPELEGSIHGSYSIKVRLDQDRVSPDYAAIVLNSDIGRRQVAVARARSAQPNVNIPELRSLIIPLWPRPVQDHIAALMQQAHAARRAMLAEAEALLRGIDGYVLGELGIELEETLDRKRFVIPFSSVVGGRLDVGPASGQFTTQRCPDLAWEPLCDIAELPSTTRIASRNPNAVYTYIGMSDVDDALGEVHIQHLKGCDIRANKVVFKGGDVVFARIEPCIYNRKIALIPPEVGEALGSTELVVARARPQIWPAFLLWILRSELIQRQIAGKMTGTTGRRRLPHRAFADLQIPKVPVEVQMAIAGEAAQRRDRAKELRRQAETIVTEARARVERMILGQEEGDS